MRVPIAVGAALASAAAWLSLLLAPGLPLPTIGGLSGYEIPAFLLPLAGIALTVAIVALRPTLMRVPPTLTMVSVLNGVVLATVLIGLAAMLLAGIQAGEVRPVNAAMVLVLATLTLAVALYALESVREGGGVSFDSNWGGLGGGMGGWRLSATAVYLVLLLVFAGATIGAALYTPAQDPPEDAAAAGKDAGKTTAAAGAAGKPAAKAASKAE